MGEGSETFGSEVCIGCPTRISSSTVSGVVVKGDGGSVAGSSVVGEHLAVHRDRSGGHRSGGLGNHRRRTDGGSGGEGEGIRPTGSCGIGSLEPGIVGGTGSQVVEGYSNRTRAMSACEGDIGIPRSLGEVGVRCPVKDLDRRVSSPGIGQVVGADGGVSADGAHVVGCVSIIQKDRNIGSHPDGDHLRGGRTREVGRSNGDIMVSDGTCPTFDLTC